MSPDKLLEYTADLPATTLAAGDVLIADGQEDPALFVVVDGAFRVERHGHLLATIDARGTVIGEIAVLLGTAATATVVATEASTVRRVVDADELFTHHPDFGRYVALVLARRLHRITTLLDDIQEQFAGQSTTLGLLPAVIADLLGSQGDANGYEALGSDREPDSPY